jgi:thymidylate synthase (FAD)
MTPILDHGYVSLIEVWGSDSRIIEAARMSTGQGFKGWGPKHSERCSDQAPEYILRESRSRPVCLKDPECGPGDERLLAYLWNNSHHTPFEMCGMTIEVQAPIFVFREWHRHRTQSYNEMSARYTPLPDVNYLPKEEALFERVDAARKAENKQAQAIHFTSEREPFRQWLRDLELVYRMAQTVYEQGLALGVPKELARLPVPVARYSRMRASTDLRNWLGFLKLRMAVNAQWEIRQYANEVGRLITENFPRTWHLFVESNPSIFSPKAGA